MKHFTHHTRHTSDLAYLAYQKNAGDRCEHLWWDEEDQVRPEFFFFRRAVYATPKRDWLLCRSCPVSFVLSDDNL